MKRTKKIVSLCAAAAILLSFIVSPVTANAATINLEYDMDTKDVGGFKANAGTDGTNSYLATDPG